MKQTDQKRLLAARDKLTALMKLFNDELYGLENQLNKIEDKIYLAMESDDEDLVKKLTVAKKKIQKDFDAMERFRDKKIYNKALHRELSL